MKSRWLRAGVAPAALTLLLMGCGGEPGPAPRRPTAPAPEPSAAPAHHEPSALWRYVTGGSSGDAAECALVQERLGGEDRCTGSLCSPARDLAREWPELCSGAGAAAVRQLAADIASRASKPTTACGNEHAAMLAKGCARDFTCETGAQRWAARCGKTEATPLSAAALERLVSEKRGKKTKLDLRDCAELRADLSGAARCADKNGCLAALPRVDAWRSRCGGPGEPPVAAAAAIELSILAGAGRETVATVVQRDSPKLGPGDLPVVLDDGWGGVIAACGKRVLSPADYFATRRGCESGDVWLVRVFVTKAKDVDVRVGSLELGNDVVFARRFPSLRVQGEAELADEAEARALEAELAPVIALANGGSQGPAAAMALGKVIAAHGAALARSAKVRAVLAAKDAELVPALRAVGTAKAAAAEKLRPVELAGLARRGARRAFADLNEVGEVAVGTLTAAWGVDTAQLLPRATAAYESALEPALKLAARKKPSAADAKAAHKAGLASAAACGAAVKRVKAAEQRLLTCAFAQEPCDPAKTAAGTKESDDAALALVQARRDLDRAMTGPGEAFRADLARAATAAGCVELWW